MSHYPVKSGLREVCVLAITLFIDWIMGETVGKNDCGISSGDAKIIDLELADNAVGGPCERPGHTEHGIRAPRCKGLVDQD